MSCNKFLLCKPDHFGVNYKINPWMNFQNPVDIELAKKQWNILHDTILFLGCEIELITGQKELPDMVFTANGGLVLNDNETVIIPSFRHEERTSEEKYFIKYFSNQGYEIKFVSANLKFEGAGDALYLGDSLIGGYGYRSQKEVYEEWISFGRKCIPVELINPNFYHLDTCFCPLQNLDYLIFPDALSSSSLNAIRSLGGKEIQVPEDEAYNFACNAVCIEENVLIPAQCPKTEELLIKNGYKTHPMDMSEFIKSGGACKCLTLLL